MLISFIVIAKYRSKVYISNEETCSFFSERAVSSRFDRGPLRGSAGLALVTVVCFFLSHEPPTESLSKSKKKHVGYDYHPVEERNIEIQERKRKSILIH